MTLLQLSMSGMNHPASTSESSFFSCKSQSRGAARPTFSPFSLMSHPPSFNPLVKVDVQTLPATFLIINYGCYYAASKNSLSPGGVVLDRS